jgi:hypothetical protein
VPIDVAILASAVVANFLVPYAKMGADAIAKEVSNKVGQTAAEHVTGVTAKVWSRVKAAFGSDPDDEATLAQLEKRPERAERAVPLVEEILKEKLEQDAKLAQDLEKLVTTPSPDGAGDSMQIMAGTVGIVYAQGASISGGVVGGVIMGSPPPQTSAPPQSPAPGGETTGSQERSELGDSDNVHDTFDKRR